MYAPCWQSATTPRRAGLCPAESSPCSGAEPRSTKCSSFGFPTCTHGLSRLRFCSGRGHDQVMASPALQRGRVSRTGHCYVITTVTAQRARVFAEPANALEVIHWLRASDDEGRTASLAWVVMPDHLHWMFVLRSTSLETVVRTVKSRAAKAMNVRRGSNGPVWQPGYYEQLQRNEKQWRSEALYILANPVRAGLAVALDDHPHSWCCWPLAGP